MKLNFKKILAGAALVALMLVNLSLVCAAAGSTSIAVSTGTVQVGETVTVTVSMRATENFYAYQMKLNYSAGNLQYVSGADAGGAG